MKYTLKLGLLCRHKSGKNIEIYYLQNVWPLIGKLMVDVKNTYRGGPSILQLNAAKPWHPWNTNLAGRGHLLTACNAWNNTLLGTPHHLLNPKGSPRAQSANGFWIEVLPNVIEPSNELSQNKFFPLLTPSMRTSKIQRGGHAAMEFKNGQQGLEQGSAIGFWTLRSTFAR